MNISIKRPGLSHFLQHIERSKDKVGKSWMRYQKGKQKWWRLDVKKLTLDNKPEKNNSFPACAKVKLYSIILIRQIYLPIDF